MINIEGIGIVKIGSQEHIDYLARKEKAEWDAKSIDCIKDEIRIDRDKLLHESDAYMFIDHPIRQIKTEQEILAYRQALRDLPNTIQEKPVSMASIEMPVL